MAGEWASALMSNIANVTDYVANGSFESLRKNVTYRSEPDYAVLVRLVDHNAGWSGDFVYVDKASYDFLRKSALAPGDIVIANVGANAGTVFRVPELGTRMTLGPNAVLCRPRDENELRREFLYYYLVSDSGQESLRTILSGSAQPKFNKTDLRKLSVPVPPLPEQRAIAHILGTLDDKIELNRCMSETLESVARAIFQSWFVDFDPVRAKAEGRDTGLPKRFADLLPDSFEDSELGEIPAGWKVGGLDQLGRFLNGLALQKYPPASRGSIPVIKIAQLRAGTAEGSDRASSEIDADYVVEDGDVLFSWSGSLECVLWAGGRGALNQHLFKVTSASHPKWFYYFWIHRHLPTFRSIAAGKATTMGHIQRHHLADAQVAVPEDRALAAANAIIAPLFDRFLGCLVESRRLAALRDALLPKLISGELPVQAPAERHFHALE